MFLIYLIFFFLILRFTVTLFNFISNPKLTRSAKEYQDFVSILIPARDEQQNILNLITSIKEQDYRNYEVIILDDHSSDDTLRLCREFCSFDDRFRVLRGRDLPKDWLGKNFACYQLAEAARGKYLIFLDADDVIGDGLINCCIHRMKTNRLDLLSLFADQIMISWGEKMIVPLMHYVLLNLVPLRLVRLSKNPAFASASGQFMMFEKTGYAENQWHEQVKGKVVEYAEIMNLLKGYGYRGETLLANGFIHCRMYKSFIEAFNGFTKNLFPGFNNSIVGLFLYLLLVILSPLAVSWILTPELLLFGGGLILLSRIMISLMSGQNPWYNLLLHPFQLLFMVLISVVSVNKYLIRAVVWKGRTIGR